MLSAVNEIQNGVHHNLKLITAVDYGHNLHPVVFGYICAKLHNYISISS